MNVEALSLVVGQRVRAMVTAIGSRLELGYAEASRSQARVSRRKPHGDTTGRSDASRLIEELQMRHRLPLDMPVRQQPQRAVSRAANPIDMTRSGLFSTSASHALQIVAEPAAPQIAEVCGKVVRADAKSTSESSGLLRQECIEQDPAALDAHETVLDVDTDARQSLGTLPVLVGGELVELDLVVFRQRRPGQETSVRGRLVMTLTTQSSGRVQIDAQALADRLIIKFSGSSIRDTEELARYADELRELVARFGWHVEAVTYEIDEWQSRSGYAMSDTMAAIGTLMRTDAETLRIIGHNLANADSVAYRRSIPVSRTDFGADASVPARAGDEETQVNVPLPQLESFVDLRPGTLRSTGGQLDLAIEGAGFFVIGTAAGEVLARRGDFKTDALGYLVTQAGNPVLGVSGPLQVNAAQLTIRTDGTVLDADRVIGRLRIVEVDADARLQLTDTADYKLEAGSIADARASLVRQGFLETSNVQSAGEMVRLLETMRRFEMAQRFVHGYDDMLEKAITTLGRI
jgi:flagellar basal-body rod protein FlgF